MNSCRRCKWHDDCGCVVCEEGATVVCLINHKHVEKDYGCDKFEERVNYY